MTRHAAVVVISRSIEDFRADRLLTVAEFAAVLGITEQTYRRIRRKDATVSFPIRRHVAERLGVPHHIIVELLPPPSDAYLDQLDAAIDEANGRGWIVGDSVTGMPTGERVMLRLEPDQGQHGQHAA